VKIQPVDKNRKAENRLLSEKSVQKQLYKKNNENVSVGHVDHGNTKI